ncbi:PD-(D/E)XK nuclease family protein [Dermabacter vaginalis]|uniref:PD-(D/E)XK nuclease family protein n=1 Tax=Dermabacter vaginalis TaxID=1630135 RepID=UPI001EF6D23E|nr:PD-(D/E)XK nuclease family protein [Dermabacter vaginalis]MCG7444300.1 PD-(D/E)XK nuclease family protein [Dermabacter vaginalis]
MRIRFGWLLDGAAWAPRGIGSARSWDMVAGPRELVGVLLTRLGLLHPETPYAVRVAHMRRLLSEVQNPWYERSCARDSWNTARAMLRLRDEALEAGWRAPAPSELEGLSQPRLSALAALEQAITVGVEGVPGANLPPGFADDLASVHAELEAIVDSGEVWPLGIEVIDCSEDPEALPGRWPAIFALLERCGVKVNVGHEHAGVPHELSIVRAPQELSAGEVAAQILEEECAGSAPVTVLAGRDTLPLDLSLTRRGLPPVAHAPEAAPRLAAQVVPIFLEASSSPVNVQALVEFLSVEVPCEKAQEAVGERQASAPVLPRNVTRALLHALGEEAGIDTRDPESAFSKALEKIRQDAENGTQNLAMVREMCAFTAEAPGEIVEANDLERRLAFLEARVEQMPRAAGPAKSIIRQHITTLRDLLDLTKAEGVNERELRELVAAAAPPARSVLARPSVTPWNTAVNEAHVDAGTVLWWGAAGAPSRRSVTWDKSEIRVLEEGGARILEAEELEALDMRAKLRALGSATKLIAVAADVVDGEHASLNPALAPLAEAWLTANPDLKAQPQEDSDPTRHRAISIEARAWAATRLKAGLLNMPEEQRFMPPSSLAREVTAGTQLMPQKLSYTQLDILHRDALAWVLRYPLGIKPGSAASVPSGNRAIGTLVHAVIETLVKEKRVPASYEIPESAVEEIFARLVPRYSSDLDLPGNEALRAYVLRRAKASIMMLFRTLRTAGIGVIEIEHALKDVPLNFTVERPDATQQLTVPLSGSIDFAGIDEHGAPVLLDFKWTNSTSRYAGLVTNNEALQLATYAWAYGAQRGERREPRTGYFLLRHGEFVTNDRGLGGRGASNEATGGSLGLFERLRATIEDELSAIAQGRVTSALGDLALENGLSSYDTAHKKAAAELAEERAEAGRVFVDHNASYSDYCLLTGLTGDYS